MKIEVEIYDAGGRKLGYGPIVAAGASVNRRLDGAGGVSFESPGTDARLWEIATDGFPLVGEERRARLHCFQGGERTELGRGVLQDLDASDTSSNWRLSATGPDDLDELKRRACHLGTTFDYVPLPTVTTTLAALAGWTASVEDSAADLLISARFDGETVLKALQQIVSQNGLHLRPGLTAKTVEVGAFGTGSGLTLLQAGQIAPGDVDDSGTALISDFKLKSSSKAVANRIFVFGAGQNLDAALTLKLSSRTGPYPIKSMVINGRTLYYLEDTASIARYDVIEKYVMFKEIAPLDNTDALIARAADALYDAAAAWLQRNAWSQDSYNLSVKDCSKRLRSGDKVHVIYRGFIEQVIEGKTIILPPRDINADFWVLSVRETAGTGGLSADLEVSNIDRYMKDVGEVIVGSIEQIRLQGMRVQPSYCLSPYGPYQNSIDSTHPVTVPLKIRETVFTLDYCVLMIKTGAFRVNAKSVSSHNHVFAFSPTPKPSTVGWTEEVFGFQDRTAGVTRYVAAKMSSVPGYGTSLFTTVNDSPPLSFPLDFGIYDDADKPDGLTVQVDGVTVASGLDAGGTGLNWEMNIAQYLQTNLRSEHTITITSTGGQGEVEVSFELWPTVTPFRKS